MTREGSLVCEVWEVVRDAVPAGKRADLATSLLTRFTEFGFDERDLQDIGDEDKYLKDAYDGIFYSEEEADEDSYDGYSEDD